MNLNLYLAIDAAVDFDARAAGQRIGVVRLKANFLVVHSVVAAVVAVVSVAAAAAFATTTTSGR